MKSLSILFCLILVGCASSELDSEINVLKEEVTPVYSRADAKKISSNILKKNLNISKTQKEQIKADNQANYNEVDRITLELAKLRGLMLSELLSKSPRRDLIQVIYERITKLQRQKLDTRIKIVKSIWKILDISIDGKDSELRAKLWEYSDKDL